MNDAKIIAVLNDYKEGKYRLSREVFGDLILIDNETNLVFVPDSSISEQFYNALDELLDESKTLDE